MRITLSHANLVRCDVFYIRSVCMGISIDGRLNKGCLRGSISIRLDFFWICDGLIQKDEASNCSVHFIFGGTCIYGSKG